MRALEVLGEPDDQAMVARSCDETGEVTLMPVRIDDGGVWHLSGGGDVAAAARRGTDVPAARAVRSTLCVARDGRSMAALWERADDGVTWQPWMNLRFTREA